MKQRITTLLPFGMLLFIYMLMSSSAFSQALDKKMHFSAGMAISSAVLTVTDNAYISIGSTVLIGLGKEVIDGSNSNNRFDSMDLTYTVAGGVIGYGLHKIGIPKAFTIGIGLGFIGIKHKF